MNMTQNQVLGIVGVAFLFLVGGISANYLLLVKYSVPTSAIILSNILTVGSTLIYGVGVAIVIKDELPDIQILDEGSS